MRIKAPGTYRRRLIDGALIIYSAVCLAAVFLPFWI